MHFSLPSPIIAIVDDDSLVGLSLSRLLQTLGFRSQYFQSGKEFLASLSDTVPDCILLDVCMPEFSGPQVVQEIRERHIKTPVIFISGGPDMQVNQPANTEQERNFLNKPYCLDDLFIKVNNALGCRGFVPQRCPWPCPIIGHAVWNCAMSGYSEEERDRLNAGPEVSISQAVEQDRHTPLLTF